MTNREKDLGVDCIDRAQAQTEIEMSASRYTLAHERGAKGEVEWSDNLIAIDDALDIIRKLPSVTPQHSSGLDKNSKKLEKDFGESDCISRADALALYCDKCSLYNCISKCSSYRAVEKMPSVTPQEPRWIPVSEKLPEEYNTVIASTDIGVVYPEARYSKEYGWEWAYESGMDYWEETESNVLAWMPLPKPFKAESEEEK